MSCNHGDLGDPPPPSPVNPEFKGLSRFNPGVNPLCRFVFVHVDWRLTFFRPLLPPFLRVSRFWVCSSGPQGFPTIMGTLRPTPKTKDLSFVTPALFVFIRVNSRPPFFRPLLPPFLRVSKIWVCFSVFLSGLCGEWFWAFWKWRGKELRNSGSCHETGSEATTKTVIFPGKKPTSTRPIRDT